MNLDIDVSGSDILSKDYTIVVANEDNLIRGFKFNVELTQVIRSRYGQGEYRYPKSRKGNSLLKIRIYCVIIYYLFKSIKGLNKISLKICRDFEGNENNINASLKDLLGRRLGLKIESIIHTRLDSDSNAHRYAYLMRRDIKDKMLDYVKISLEEIEEFLKK